MGLLSSIGTTFSTIGNVGSGVFGIVKSAGKLVGKVANSLVGRIAIGGGLAMILMSNPLSGEDSPLSGITDGFKSFFGKMSDAATSKMASAGTEAALGATAATLAAGRAANSILDDVTGKSATLEGSVAEGGTAAYESGGTAPEPGPAAADTEQVPDGIENVQDQPGAEIA